jgi:hypothetical protein
MRRPPKRSRMMGREGGEGERDGEALGGQKVRPRLVHGPDGPGWSEETANGLGSEMG